MTQHILGFTLFSPPPPKKKEKRKIEITSADEFLNSRYPDNSPPGQFAQTTFPRSSNNEPLVLLSTTEPNEPLNISTQDLTSHKLFFVLLSATEQIIRLRSFIHALPNLKIGGELSGANCPEGELSDIRTIILTQFFYFSLDFFL